VVKWDVGQWEWVSACGISSLKHTDHAAQRCSLTPVLNGRHVCCNERSHLNCRAAHHHVGDCVTVCWRAVGGREVGLRGCQAVAVVRIRHPWRLHDDTLMTPPPLRVICWGQTTVRGGKRTTEVKEVHPVYVYREYSFVARLRPTTILCTADRQEQRASCSSKSDARAAGGTVVEATTLGSTPPPPQTTHAAVAGLVAGRIRLVVTRLLRRRRTVHLV